MKEKLMRFMIGRYGNDPLNQMIQIVALVLLVASMFVPALYSFALALMVLVLFRFLSRNTLKRQAEYRAYERARSKVVHVLDITRKLLVGTKTHRYYRCPSCKQVVRVPRGHGVKTIRCPKCEATFTKKT